MELLWSLWVEGLPVAEKTYLFKEVYIEIIIKKPEKVGEKVGLSTFRLQVGFRG